MTKEQVRTRLERRLIELESLLAEVGAEHRPDGWFWPFYRAPGVPDLMMPTQQWIAARRLAARDLLPASVTDDLSASPVIGSPRPTEDPD